jgi:hypothetical protein
MLDLEVELYSSRVTLCNLVQIQLVAADLAQWEWKAVVRDVVVHHKTVVNLSFPLAVDEQEVALPVVAAAAAAVVDVVGRAPYTAG